MLSLVLISISFHILVINSTPQNRVNPFTSNLVCGSNLLIANVNFQQPFYGIIYAKGFSLECRVYGNGSQVIHFQTSIHECGVKTSQNTFSDNQYELVLYVQNDANIEQASDEKIEAKCLPQPLQSQPKQPKQPKQSQQSQQPHSSKLRVSNLFGESRIQVHQMRTHNFTLNDISDSLECRMDVMKGRLPFLKPIDGFVDLGQDVTVIIKIKQIAGVDSHLSRCYAHDGTHAIKQELTNTNGCAIDTNILPNFNKIANYGSDSKLYYTTFPAFKFPDRTNLNIQCTVVICNTTCPQVDCSIESTRNSYIRRVKRSSNGDNTSVGLTNEHIIDGYNSVLSEIGISNSIGVNSVDSNRNIERNNSSFGNIFTIELVSCLTSQMILNFGLLLTMTFFATVFVCCYCGMKLGMKVRELNEKQWSNKKYHQYNDSHQSLPHTTTQTQDVHSFSYGPMLDLTN